MALTFLCVLLLGEAAMQVNGLTVQGIDKALSVMEGTELGSVLGVFTVSDEHGRVTVYPADDETQRHVIIEPVQFASTNETSTSTQFKIVLYRILDAEMQSIVKLQFSAVNIIMEKIDFSMQLLVLDVNDNAPIFDRSQYSFAVSKNASPGTIVGRVQAIDRDAGINGVVSYSLQINPDFASMFSIDTVSGQITLLKQPGPKTTQLSFAASASDNGMPARFSSVVTVTVTFL